MIEFEWDPVKNKANKEKHGISFEEAIFVFSDKENLTIPDAIHSTNEDRWITIGQINNWGIIVVIHTERFDGDSERIRIISARSASNLEKTQYQNFIGDNYGK